MKNLMPMLVAVVVVTAATACGPEPPTHEQSETCMKLMLLRRSLNEGQLPEDHPLRQATTSSRLELWRDGTWTEADDARFALPYTYDGQEYRATCHIEDGFDVMLDEIE